MTDGEVVGEAAGDLSEVGDEAELMVWAGGKRRLVSLSRRIGI